MITTRNVLTVDLEEWFVVEVLAGRYTPDDWPKLPATVVRNTRRLLELFHRKDRRATFFVLGWCAEQYPQLMREIVDAGHEIACHSYYHVRVDSLTPEQFRHDTTRVLDAVVAATGVKPIGYRAPSWSLNPSTTWAFEILSELGFEYDSSIFPIKHDLYGVPGAPRNIFKMSLTGGKTLWEVPASTIRFLGQNLPVTGGGYLRHSPYWYSRAMIRKLNREGLPAIVYIHPWELDPDLPKIEGLSAMQRFRTYGSTSVLAMKLERLLGDFDFVSMSEYVMATTRRKIGFEHG
jgi:polysaccharide deacetylase family protein (PEP-CTERM system associated)